MLEKIMGLQKEKERSSTILPLFAVAEQKVQSGHVFGTFTGSNKECVVPVLESAARLTDILDSSIGRFRIMYFELCYLARLAPDLSFIMLLPSCCKWPSRSEVDVMARPVICWERTAYEWWRRGELTSIASKLHIKWQNPATWLACF